MSSRSTRYGVRTSAGIAAQQPLNRNFISGGQAASPNIPLTTEATPPAPAAPAAPPAAMKMEADVTMESAEADDKETGNGDSRRRPWMSVKKPGVKRKPNKQLIQHRLKKQLTPKNATVALQEVCPGLVFTYSQQGAAPTGVFTAEVEVQGKKYHGVGSNKALARAAAAELALQSFIKTPVRTTDDNGREVIKDDTPWAALAGFALHKLFCDWKRGNVGVPLSVESAAPAPDQSAAAEAARAAAKAAAAPQAAPWNRPSTAMEVPSFTLPPLQPVPADAPPAGPAQPEKERKVKTLPEDWASRNPAQLLHEMRPDLRYDVNVEHLPADGPGKSIRVKFTTTTEVNGQTYSGVGSTKKKSKRELAKVALQAVYGCVFPDEATE